VATQAVAVASQYVGTPFFWGGESPEIGFDSPGLVRFSYRQVGVELPRVASNQFLVGAQVAALDLLPGDLVFFQDATGYVHHVGIYIASGTFIHAPHTGDVVKYSNLDEAYYYSKFAGAKRVAQ
jgi:peptidoglycan DL-endopeptidase CwlO